MAGAAEVPLAPKPGVPRRLNVNVGVLGHIDSGKTALARALSTIGSTAAFDRAPQSRARGITLDLGFSCLCTELPPHLGPEPGQLQLTLVDCPGHASLIRTIIGGKREGQAKSRLQGVHFAVQHSAILLLFRAVIRFRIMARDVEACKM